MESPQTADLALEAQPNGPSNLAPQGAKRRQRDWTNLSVVIALHLVAAFAVVYLTWIHFSWWTLGLGFLWFAFCGLSITGGYHRLFSHPTYRAGAPLRLFYLLFGAASVQNSALKWSSDHRIHHAHTDTDRDPYNIRRGFWWAHIGWLFFKERDSNPQHVNDLEDDPLVRFQHKYYVPLAIFMAAIVPLLLGFLWGDPIGAMLVAGVLRLVVQWHATFSVNSFAHKVGSQPFCKRTSARDSFWVALMTMGEGYHNFHHRFPMDYRNGVRWFHFDPTKWFLWTLSKTGMVWNLRRAKPRRESQRVAA